MEANYIVLASIILFLTAFLLYSIRFTKFKRLDAYSFVCMFYAFSAFCSFVFYNASNGVFRDYHNITIPPAIYWNFCILVSFVPLRRYCVSSPNLIVSNKQYLLIDKLSVFMCIIAIIPFVESMFHLPTILANQSAAADIYDKRLAGIATSDYLSWFGRKFYFIEMLLSLVTPWLLCLQLKKERLNKKLIFGLIACVLTDIIHEMSNGGRSGLVQNFLYLFMVYMLFKGQMSPKVVKKVNFYGLIICGVAVMGLMVVTLARFASDDNGNMDNPFIWMSLYAGEGLLNFNNNYWYINPPYSGYGVNSFLMGIIDGHFRTVEESWEAGFKLGIQGNIFYTWVSSFFSDFGKYGALMVICLMSFVLSTFRSYRRKRISVLSLGLLCLYSKILVVGVTFYTYGTTYNQMALYIAIIFLLYLNKMKKV